MSNSNGLPPFTRRPTGGATRDGQALSSIHPHRAVNAPTISSAIANGGKTHTVPSLDGGALSPAWMGKILQIFLHIHGLLPIFTRIFNRLHVMLLYSKIPFPQGSPGSSPGAGTIYLNGSFMPDAMVLTASRSR